VAGTTGSVFSSAPQTTRLCGVAISNFKLQQTEKDDRFVIAWRQTHGGIEATPCG
jgi:hypothetical protein